VPEINNGARRPEQRSEVVGNLGAEGAKKARVQVQAVDDVDDVDDGQASITKKVHPSTLPRPRISQEHSAGDLAVGTSG
jgi:hypothetical protein